MTARWAAFLPETSAESLAACRHIPAVQVAMSDSGIWLCGPDRDVLASAHVKAVPGIKLFELDDEEGLTPPGRRLSVGTLPKLSWGSLREQVHPRLPPAGFAGRQFQPVALTLQPSRIERDVNVLIVPGLRLLTIADTMPAVRIRNWRIAVRNNGDALVWGRALPPVDGQRFWEESGVAFPAGLAPLPEIGSPALAVQLCCRPGDLLLCSSGTAIERIRAEHFVQATRTAVRLSCRKEPA
ncbi:MAG TPA: hypothetical protein VM510_04705 [Caulifigura sp.]|nr:hypothetical protein [Caulifigura sp.]